MFRRTRWLAGWLAIALPACNSGGGGNAGAGGNLQPFAIDDAASPAVAADVRDLLEVGDRFSFEPDVAQANAMYDALWARLVTANEWLEPGDNTTYEFFDDTDPITSWGRAYRYFGQGTFAGPIVPFTAGTYTRPSGTTLPALTLRTWDGSHAELLVMLDDDTFVHAIQNTNGLPIVESSNAAEAPRRSRRRLFPRGLGGVLVSPPRRRVRRDRHL